MSRTELGWGWVLWHINHWCFWFNYQRIIKGTEGFGNKRMSGGNQNYYITENGQNTEKSPEDLRGFAVSQTPVKDHQLTLMWESH